MPTLNFNEKLRISFDKHQLDVEDEQHSYTSLTQPNISCEEGDSLKQARDDHSPTKFFKE